MAEYKLEIEGKFDLPEINLQILGEEAGASEFLSSSVQPGARKARTNMAIFRELPSGTVPNKLFLVADGTAQPPNTNKVWSGTMIVKGVDTAVSAFRAI